MARAVVSSASRLLSCAEEGERSNAPGMIPSPPAWETCAAREPFEAPSIGAERMRGDWTWGNQRLRRGGCSMLGGAGGV